MCKKKKHDKLGAMFALSQCKKELAITILYVTKEGITIVVNVTLII